MLVSRFVRHCRARNKYEWCSAENGQPYPVIGSTVVLTKEETHSDQSKS